MFNEKIDIRERCKGVHCVDLGESFPTRIYLQKSASIQPRTSPSKFEGKFNSLFTSLLSDFAIGNEINFEVQVQNSESSNFRTSGLVLGCIEAKFCK